VTESDATFTITAVYNDVAENSIEWYLDDAFYDGEETAADSDDDSEETEDDAATEEDADESDDEATEGEDSDETDSRDVQDAKDARNYARAYFLLTDKILTAKAVISYFEENSPDADIENLRVYLTSLETLRARLEAGEKLDEIQDTARELIVDAKGIVEVLENAEDIDRDDLKEYVTNYKEVTDEEDEAKEAWADARSAYVEAKADAIVLELESIAAFVESVVGEEDAAELREVVDEIEVLAQELAEAEANFDDEEAKEIKKELHDLLKDASKIIKDLWKEVKDEWKVNTKLTGAHSVGNLHGRGE
jgi:hypothetical protein